MPDPSRKRRQPIRLLSVELPGRDMAVVATVQLARHQLTDALGRRPAIRVIRVTKATRDGLPEQPMESLVGGRQGKAR